MKDQLTTRRRSSSSSTMAKQDKKLTLEEAKCPVCWSILMKPVTLPCTHSLCLECYESTVQKICFNCPCCRMRISNWSRKAEKDGGLVNHDLWDKIQLQFPKYVEARLLGDDSQNIREEDLELPELESDDDAINSSITHVPNTNDEVNGMERNNELSKTSNEAPDMEIASQNLIRQLKADDGFGTQQVIFDFDDDIEQVSEVIIETESCSVETNDSRSKSPEKNNHEQGNSLCRNLLSEWGTDQAKNKLSVPNAKFLKGRRNTCHTDSVSTATQTRSGKDGKRSSKETSTTNNMQKLDCDSSITTASTSRRETVFDDKGVSSSFVPVYSPCRTETSHSAKTVAGISSSLPLDCGTAELENKNKNNIKRSQVKITSDTPDSIHFEVNSHFRPIYSATRTPPKRLPDGSYLPEPRLVKSTPMRLGSAPPTLKMSSINPPQTTTNRDNMFLTKKSDNNDASNININGVPPNGKIYSPPPPILMHYALQSNSPNRFICSPEAGRTTKSPPQLDAYDSTNNEDVPTKRQLSDLMYKKAQALQLEQFQKRKIQEDQDRAYAKKLQQQLNRRNYSSRTRESSDRYEIRNWIEPTTNSPSSSTVSTEPSPSKIPAKKGRPRKKEVDKCQTGATTLKLETTKRKGSSKRQNAKRSRVEEESDSPGPSHSTRTTRRQSKKVRKA